MVDFLCIGEIVEMIDMFENVDILLLNICFIWEKVQEKVFYQFGCWKLFKNSNLDLIIGVGGCVVSQEGQVIIDWVFYVDMVFGLQILYCLLDMIIEVCVKGNGVGVVDVSFLEIEKFDKLLELGVDGFFVFVFIMEGCSKYCIFCVVFYICGEEVSCLVDDVIVEVVYLVSQGVWEVNLLGQNVNVYQGEIYDGDIMDLVELIILIVIIDGIDCICYIILYLVEFIDVMIEVYEQVLELVSYLYLLV